MPLKSKMFNSITRIIALRAANTVVASRVFCQRALVDKNVHLEQIEYIRNLENNVLNDWSEVKNNVLLLRGYLTQKNIDAVLLKVLVGNNNFTAAESFVKFLQSSNEELSIGLTNSILNMYKELGRSVILSEEQKQFILNTYKSLYEKYKVLDSSTCEHLLHTLCLINEWEKALKVLDNIHMSSVPSHSAYSTLIATLFKLNKKKKALELVDQSIKNKRQLQHNAFEEWLQYILRKYKNKKTISKNIDEIFKHIAINWTVIPEKTADRIKQLYTSLDWSAQYARIRKKDGQCSNCMESLQCLSLSDEEFKTLQQNIKEKLIIGSDLLLKTTHGELKRFLEFIERVAPYDIVLDGLNISYTIGKSPHINKLQFLDRIIDHFLKDNKKVLLLSRKHVMTWNRRLFEKITKKTYCFFTENLSEDDPFFITAAILSGPHTDIMSKDLLRTHKFNLQDDNLKQIFKRWQLQHQWMVFRDMQNRPIIQPPLKFTPCAQKSDNTWHIPYECETNTSFTMVNVRSTEFPTWLCLRSE